jgi:GTPase KRas protein
MIEHMNNVEGFFLIYSVTDEVSFNKIKSLQQKITLAKKSKNVPIVLVGNKIDLEDQRKIPTQQGQDLANSFGCAFIETSAKTRYNVDAAFELLVDEVRKSRGVVSNNKSASSTPATPNSPSSSSSNNNSRSTKSPASKGDKSKDKCMLQ